MNVNTTKIGSQDNLVKKPLMLASDHTAQAHGGESNAGAQALLRCIDIHATDIEGHTLAAQTLCEMCFEEIDSYGDSIVPDVGRTMLRLDALLKAISRNCVVAQEGVDAIAVMVRGGAA
ncbi:hypothetical protein [Massilia aquatica]|uniref:Uncharacterized protein n=1 Tax=Massilia aquatica TaxID=2609000 RepID=A0ABX0M1F9_9BURK|nr:hypothetical protein [Massilia aquatica]NHZ40089.1 hypothetical protein [Massilia aquatica]